MPCRARPTGPSSKENTILVAEDTQQTRQRYQEEIIKSFRLSNVNDKQDLGQIATALRSLLLMNKVAQIDSQNTIVVRDTPDKVAAAERIVRSIDKSKPEVMIEVYILEVVGTSRQFLGLKPGLPSVIDVSPNGPQAEGPNTLSLNELGRLGTESFSRCHPLHPTRTALHPRPRAACCRTPPFGLQTGKRPASRSAPSNPSRREVFPPESAGGTGFGGGAFTTFSTVDVGVTLEITPRVLLNRDISMKINIALKTISGFETLDGNRYPILANREITHDIRLREGESSVVGGIIQRSDTVTVDGVPGLSKIPLLRYLFSTQDNTVSDNEIIVVITPRIVRLPDLLQQDTSLALLGSSNTPKFLGSPKQLIGEIPAPGPASGQAPSPQGISGPTAGEGASSDLGSPTAGDRSSGPPSGFRQAGPPLGTRRSRQSVPGRRLGRQCPTGPRTLLQLQIQSGTGSVGGCSGRRISQQRWNVRGPGRTPGNSLGRAVISMTRPPDSSGVSGAGLLMNLRFEAVGSGDGAISFGPNSVLRDSRQAPIPTSLASTPVTIQ